MIIKEVKTPEEAFVYMTECTLATVADMAGKRYKNKGEYCRQIDIAQIGIDWIRDINIDVRAIMEKWSTSRLRVLDVLKMPDHKVKTWCKKWEGS